jgi:16S rRNA (uracil1498-N3)-methyltransferase
MRFLLVPAAQAPGPGLARIPLTPEQQHHLTHVLRRGPGDTVDVVVAGRRMRLAARIARAALPPARASRGARALELAVESEEPLPPAPRPALVLAVGLLKAAKLDAAVRMATELGLAGVALVRTERSVTDAGPAGPSPERLRRLEQIAWNACQQSGNTDPPALTWAPSVDALLAARPPGCDLVVAVASGGERLAALAPDPDRDQMLVVGPEGDLSPEEVSRARAAGARTLTLAGPVLRAETACPVLAALLLARMGRL